MEFERQLLKGHCISGDSSSSAVKWKCPPYQQDDDGDDDGGAYSNSHNEINSWNSLSEVREER